MKNSSWYPTCRHHHREGNKGSTEPPREPNRALQNPLNGDERDGATGGVGSAYGDDGGERQEVRIQHGPHGPP